MSKGLTGKVLKVISLFTGMEGVGILCGILKGKLVAMWLGAAGVGLFGILNSTADTMAILTGLGLRQSGVRELALKSGNREGLRKAVSRLRGWTLLAGIVGSLLMGAFSPLLSIFFFEESSHWWEFVLVGVALLLNSVVGGEQAILQATERFKSIARAGAEGAVGGLLISIPMFRWLGEGSVPLSILAYSAMILFFLRIHRNREVDVRPRLQRGDFSGSGFVRLGIYMAGAAFLSSMAQMLFLSWLSRNASASEVGYYQAGNTLIYRYMGLIFGAVGLEFYPRMSANSYSSTRMSLFVSHEISLLLKVFTPMLLLYLICRVWIVKLLYTEEFLVIVPYISIGILTVVIKAVSTCMAFSILAKGEGRTYLLTEGADAAIGLGLNVLLYRLYGLTGVGLAQVLWCLIYAVMVGTVYFGRYGLRISRGAAWLIAASWAISLAACVYI